MDGDKYDRDLQGNSIPSLKEPEVPESRTMYLVFVAYGFSALAIFNTILSTLDFFIAQMPGYNPSFWVGLGLNLFVSITMIFVLVYGHLLSYGFKNHVAILLQIPLTLSLPLGAYYIEVGEGRFLAYVFNMMILGAVNSLQLTGIYG